MANRGPFDLQLKKVTEKVGAGAQTTEDLQVSVATSAVSSGAHVLLVTILSPPIKQI